MATNWILTKKQVALIAQALQTLDRSEQMCFGYKASPQEIEKLATRFASSAEMNSEQNNNVKCSCKDCS